MKLNKVNVFALTLIFSFAAIQSIQAQEKTDTSPNPQQTESPQNRQTAADLEGTVWVAKSDGSKSCDDKDMGVSLDKAAGELTSVGVGILAKRKISDNKMRIQMCGADRGEMNGFEIPRKDLEKAMAKDFQPMP